MTGRRRPTRHRRAPSSGQTPRPSRRAHPRAANRAGPARLNTFSNVSGSDDGASPRNAPPPSPGGGSPHGPFSADGGSGGSLSGRRGTGPERSFEAFGKLRRLRRRAGLVVGMFALRSVIMRSYQRKCTVPATTFLCSDLAFRASPRHAWRVLMEMPRQRRETRRRLQRLCRGHDRDWNTGASYHAGK